MKKYKARCKEKNELAAAANGHSHIYPEADCLISGDTAIFSRQGKEIWRCSAIYARAQFGLSPARGDQP
ncbi:hypothetical protein [Achromobacter sp. DH1f]|uniref:hypothetical protein n=1 Tax=Achromobacter sp. DH1f TaxID=1397275 RepID=UPI0009DF102B|nr:hypothetical protein [Achromobacter sp. DH1f]